jgi:hypothetical protein
VDTITGTWKGALISDDGQRTRFAFNQPSHSVMHATPVISIEGSIASAQLLEGAARSFVALAEGPRDPQSGRLAQLLLEARVLGDRLVGHWLRRDACGEVVAEGRLVGVREMKLGH